MKCWAHCTVKLFQGLSVTKAFSSVARAVGLERSHVSAVLLWILTDCSPQEEAASSAFPLHPSFCRKMLSGSLIFPILFVVWQDLAVKLILSGMRWIGEEIKVL